MVTLGSQMISGPQNAVLWNVTDHMVKTFHNTFHPINLYNSYFTVVLLYVSHNTRLAPVTACGSQSTACDIEMRWGNIGLASTVFLRKMI